MIKGTINLNIRYSGGKETRDQLFLKAGRESFKRRKYQLGLKGCRGIHNIGESKGRRSDRRVF